MCRVCSGVHRRSSVTTGGGVYCSGTDICIQKKEKEDFKSRIGTITGG